MDHDVLDVLCELGCFSATGTYPSEDLPSEQVGEVAVDSDDEHPLDDLWIDLGGEG